MTTRWGCLSEKELKRKWESLRTQYTRYKRLAVCTIRQQWILARLQFLEPHTSTKKTPSKRTVRVTEPLVFVEEEKKRRTRFFYPKPTITMPCCCCHECLGNSSKNPWYYFCAKCFLDLLLFYSAYALYIYYSIVVILCCYFQATSGTRISFEINKVLSYFIISPCIVNFIFFNF